MTTQQKKVTYEDIVKVCELVCKSEDVDKDWLSFLMQHTTVTMGKSTLRGLLLRTGVAKAIKKKVAKHQCRNLIRIWKRHCSLKTTTSTSSPVLFSSGSQKKWRPLSNLYVQ